MSYILKQLIIPYIIVYLSKNDQSITSTFYLLFEILSTIKIANKLILPTSNKF